LTGSISLLTPLRFVEAEPSRRGAKRSHNLTGATQFNGHSGKWNIHRYKNTGQELPDSAACYAELVRRINEIATHDQGEAVLRA
jgi:hypothetical protein